MSEFSQYPQQTIEILKVERKAKERAASLVFGVDASTVHGTEIVGKLDGFTLYFSKRDDDWTWGFDGRVAANGMPLFMHGTFSMLSQKVDASTWLGRALDAAAEVAR